MKKIAVIGSLNMDLVVQVENMPRVGETIFGSQFMEIPGGKGANQAVAIARLGGDVGMIGRVGQDGFGSALLENLARDGVDVGAVKAVPHIATGTALIMVNKQGNNSIVVVPGANFSLDVNGLDDPESIRTLNEAEIVLMQLEVPLKTVTAVLKQARSAGKYTILNPAPAIPLDEEVFRYVDLLVPNETELEKLSGMPTDTLESMVAGAQSLLKKGVKEILVTMGEKGCLFVSSEQVKSYAAYSVKAVDTTAAGDSFAGAIAVGLAENLSWEETIGFAMKVGALTVMKSGAQSALPHRMDVEKFEGGLYEKGEIAQF